MSNIKDLIVYFGAGLAIIAFNFGILALSVWIVIKMVKWLW
jgi:hypothetical protein